jgi:4-amino-4-deoxy-L-arabinose transferase-like glycosyltransferase
MGTDLRSASGGRPDDALEAADGAHPGEDPDATLDEQSAERDDPRRRPLTRHEARWLVGIVALAAVLRVAWLAFAHVDPPVEFLQSGDQYSYWYHANEIASGRGYHSYITGEATAYYPIGYPAILAGLFWVAGRVPFLDPDLMLVAGAFHVVVSIATVVLTFVVGQRLLGPRAGLAAAALMAVFPNMIYQVSSLQLETTFVFFTMAALAIILDHDWAFGAPSRNRLLAFGAVLSISALIRPFSTPLLLGLLLALVAVGVGWRRALLATSIPVVVLVVAFTPWTIRNAVQLDAFVPSSTNMGDTLCIDRNLEASGGFRWSSHDGCVDPDLPEVERNRGNTRKAIEFVVEHPGREVLQIARRARLMFAEDHDGVLAVETMGSGPIFSDGTRNVLETLADWYFFVIVAFAALGLPLLVRRSPRPERWLVVVPLVAVLVIPLLLWGNPRFHLPLAPFLAVSAAALVTITGQRAHERTQ